MTDYVDKIDTELDKANEEKKRKDFRLGYFSRREQMGKRGAAEYKGRKNTKRDRFDSKRKEDDDKVVERGVWLIEVVRKNPDLSPLNAGKAVDTAQELMRIGHNSGELRYSLLGAKLYEALGRGDSRSVQNRLYRDVKGAIQEARNLRYKHGNFDKEIDEARAFFKRHTKEGDSLSSRLTMVALVASSFLLSVVFALNSFTGYAVVGASPTAPNIFGVLFFLLGIIGSFILLKNN